MTHKKNSGMYAVRSNCKTVKLQIAGQR